MKLPERLPDEFFSGIHELSIDASSIIYLLKIGILGSVSAEIRLFASQKIIEEVGWPRLPITPTHLEREGLTNDETVVELAKIRRIPVMSEDLEVLESAGTNGLSYYNTLMILNYLLLKKRISREEYPQYFSRLKDISHYSEEILQYGLRIKEQVCLELDK